MAARDPRIDAYIAKARPFARPILEHIREVVHRACPDVEETMKWSFPHFDYRGMMCSMAAFKAHVALNFWKGRLLAEHGVPGGDATGMGQFGRIASLADLPGDRVLTRIVKAARVLNEDGVRVERREPAKKPPVRPPADLTSALKANRRALATFERFSASHKREYVEWISEAKRAETRARRIAQAVEWMAEGKSQNWRYEKRA